MQGRGRRLGSSTATITSDLELLTPSRRAPKSESKSESEHEYTFSNDEIQDKAIDTLKNDIPESVPPRVNIPEGVQYKVIRTRGSIEDIENQIINILKDNNVQDGSSIYISVQKVHNDGVVNNNEVVNNIVIAMSFGVIILIIVGILVYAITKISN
jgi:hypothetical protein